MIEVSRRWMGTTAQKAKSEFHLMREAGQLRACKQALHERTHMADSEDRDPRVRMAGGRHQVGSQGCPEAAPDQADAVQIVQGRVHDPLQCVHPASMGKHHRALFPVAQYGP
jgi:hypothetical protein